MCRVNDLDALRRLNVLWYGQSLVIYRMLLVRLQVRKRNEHVKRINI